MMKYYVLPSTRNRKHFQVWTNFDIMVFQTIRCKQGRKNKTIHGLYAYECTRLDVKIMRDNPSFHEVKEMIELEQ